MAPLRHRLTVEVGKPPPIRAIQHGIGDDPNAELELVIDQDEVGKPICTRISVSKHRVTARMLRTVALDELVRHAWGFYRSQFRLEKRVPAWTYVIPPLDEQRALYREHAGIVDLDRLAAVYRKVLDYPAPTVAVAETFGVSRSTAGRWLKEARDRGILQPALPGRAGERNAA